MVKWMNLYERQGQVLTDGKNNPDKKMNKIKKMLFLQPKTSP
jgi:hypothetical protein